MTSKYLWQLGSIIITLLGLTHLYYTFFTNKFSSKNENMVAEMKSSYPILTKKTTMWKAWIGFNASHSSGAIFIGIINFYLTAKYFSILRSDHLFFVINILTIGYYIWLAKKYWFKIPLIGLSVSLVCFVLSYVLILV